MRIMSEIVEVNFQYDFTMKYYLLDASFLIIVLVIEKFQPICETMLPHIQTT